MDCWEEKEEGAILLLPRLPDIRKLYLEPTTGSNLNCRTCIRRAWEDPEAYMPMETYHRLIGQISGLPQLKKIIFSGLGEPLMHPELFWELSRSL